MKKTDGVSNSERRHQEIATAPGASQLSTFKRLKRLTGWDKMTFSNWRDLSRGNAYLLGVKNQKIENAIGVT